MASLGMTAGEDGADTGLARKYRRYRTQVMIAITAGYGLMYTCRLAINVVKKPLIDGHIFTPQQLGTIGSALYFAYAAGKLTNGFVADHVSARRFITLGILVSALLTIGMGFAQTVWLAALLWGMNGWFQSMGAPASVVAMTAWFSNRERGTYYGIWSTAHSIGEGLTFAGVAAIAAWLGWRWGFFAPGIICIAAAAMTYWLLTDRPGDAGLPPIAEWRGDHGAAPATDPSTVPHSARSVLATQLSILKIPAVWVLAISSASVYVSRYAIDSWGVLYLQEVRGYSLAQAGTMLTASTVAGVIGSIAFGFISDRLFGARRPPVNLLFSILQILGLWITLFGPSAGWVVVLGLFLFGLGLTGLVTSVGGLFAIDVCPKRVAGAALGLIGVFSYLGAAMQDWISGVLIQRGLTQVNGANHYDFGAATWFWMGSSLVALVLPLLLWNTRYRD